MGKHQPQLPKREYEAPGDKAKASKDVLDSAATLSETAQRLDQTKGK